MSEKYEVLIVGGGVIGLSIARELHRNGVRRIAVVERGSVGQEASWAAAGMLSPNVETDVGTVFHRFCRESLEMYPRFAAELFDETGVDVELDRSGTMFVAFGEDDGKKLVAEYQKLHDAGIEVETLSGEDILKAEPELSSLVQTGLSFSSDWQVENRKLLAALRRYAELNGIEIIENTSIDELTVESGRVRGARSESAEYLANATVLATGAWTSLIKFGGFASPISIKPIRGQMIRFDCGTRFLEKVVYGPGCYLVPRVDGRILAGSTTEDVGFEKGVTETAVKHLSEAAYAILPALRELEIAGSWSGLRPRSEDAMPVIGSVTGFEDLAVATGHYRNGILAAPHTAKIVAERIVSGAKSAYFDAFDPNRFAAAVSAKAK